jgi:hypothetical protein
MIEDEREGMDCGVTGASAAGFEFVIKGNFYIKYC